MILTDREIKIYVRRQLITLDPEPEDLAYQSTAVDLKLDPTISIFTKPRTVRGIQQFTRVDPADPEFKADEVIRALTQNQDIHPDNGYPLEPGILILGWTKEFIDLKQSRLAARVEGKSSLSRLGLSIHLTAPTIHAGFQGRIRLEIVNHGHHPIILRSDMRICQLIFEQTLGTPDKDYEGQFAGQLPEPPAAV
ncbi:MAG: dCTP deaminase [Stellaceae bacterium]